MRGNQSEELLKLQRMRKAAQVKIEEVQTFQPVTIVIETRGEADLIQAALGDLGASSFEDDMVYRIYRALGGNQPHPKYVYNKAGHEVNEVKK